MKNYPLTVTKYLPIAIICSAGLVSGCKLKQGIDPVERSSLSTKDKKTQLETHLSIATPNEANANPTTAKTHIKEKLKKLPPASPQEQKNAKAIIKDYLNENPRQKNIFHEFSQLLDLKETYFIDECASVAGGVEAFEGFMELLDHELNQPAIGNKTFAAFMEEFIEKKNKGELSRIDKEIFKGHKKKLETVFKTFIQEVKESQAKNGV